ncbi:MAG: hypothetical protein ACE5EA_09775 [Nitrospirota bacterium]
MRFLNIIGRFISSHPLCFSVLSITFALGQNSGDRFAIWGFGNSAKTAYPLIPSGNSESLLINKEQISLAIKEIGKMNAFDKKTKFQELFKGIQKSYPSYFSGSYVNPYSLPKVMITIISDLIDDPGKDDSMEYQKKLRAETQNIFSANIIVNLIWLPQKEEGKTIISSIKKIIYDWYRLRMMIATSISVEKIPYLFYISTYTDNSIKFYCNYSANTE